MSRSNSIGNRVDQSSSLGTADVLVGREDEVARVSAFLADLTSPRALVLEGEAGIGKTSLWRAGVRTARERGLRVLVSRPSGADVSLSFAALGDLLHGESLAVLPSLPPPQRRALESALVLTDATDIAADYRTLGLAVLRILRARAAEGAFVIAIDDVQWLDPASARVLEFALRRLEQEPVGLLASLRTVAEEPQQPPLDIDRVFATPPERLELRALRIDALQDLLRQRSGLNLSRPMLVRLHQTTNGNPFYALEIARALDHAGDVQDLKALPLTATLREVVQQRLAGVPKQTRRTLLAAATLSQPSIELLGRWAGSHDRALRDLERARRAGIVDIDGERVRFAHPLFAAGVYTHADIAERRKTHAELASVVADPEERARHLAYAATGPDAAVVSELWRAATLARSRGAPDAALELLDEALRLSSGEGDDVARLELDAAETAHTVGDHLRARRLLERTVDRQPPSRIRAQALVLLSRVMHDFAAAEPLLRDARAEAGDDPLLLSEIERNLASNAWAMLKPVSIGLGHARAAVTFAEAAEDDHAYRHALAWLVRFESLAALAPHRNLSAFAESHEREEPLRMVQGVRFTWAQLLDYQDDIEAAASVLAELRHEAETVGNFWALGPVLQTLALTCWRLGQWEAARELAAESVAVTRTGGDASGMAPALGALSFITAHMGDRDAAFAAAEEGLARVQEASFWFMELRYQHALAALELSLGAPEQACERLDGFASRRWSAGVRDPSVVRNVPDEVEALVALGEIERAVAALEPFQRHAETLSRPWALGTAARCRGIIAAASSDQSTAWDAFERALEVQRQIPEPYELGRTLLAYGVARRRAKMRAEARDLLAEALSIFEKVGARAWAHRTREESERTGTHRGSGDELTATERQIAELVAAGRSNKAVAAELFMSVKTVEGNLSRIYRKLGVASRTQLARRLTDSVL